MTLKALSLFSGIGGFEIACGWAGIEVVGQVEIDPFCRRVLEKHWPAVPRWGDIRELEGQEVLDICGRIDIVLGGFPCQPFSAAGKRKGSADDRYLWPEMVRVVREINPRWVVGENVRGLLSSKYPAPEKGTILGDILRDLAQSGYRVGWVCYGARDVGAPHRRDRVFIVAYHDKPGLQEVERQAPPQQGKDWPYVRLPGADGPLVDPGCPGLQVAQQRGTPCAEERPPGPAAQRDGGPRGEGATLPCLGGVPHGFPTEFYGHKWPAGPGEQYPWEPPRLASGEKDRIARLKALGNAVVPQQAYPILKAIAGQEPVPSRRKEGGNKDESR